MLETTAEDAWAELPKLIRFPYGFELWDVERLVRFDGAQRAGARIIERIEQQLAKNNIGHLPTKLPTDGTCQVLLYCKDEPGLPFIVRLVHDLATKDVNDDTNASVHMLHTLLQAMRRTSQAAARKDAP
ncbi:hypothetical protein ACIQW4_17450 [Streptomyces albogriseolus]|uniref:hypothetical protein n=1 Tax=Streptomyces albogriseolus TaxID=1887 RepID=UPI0038267457